MPKKLTEISKSISNKGTFFLKIKIMSQEKTTLNSTLSLECQKVLGFASAML